MVLTMELEQQTTQGQICDTQNSGINHQRSIDLPTKSVDLELAKRTLKLDLQTTTTSKSTNRQKSKEDDEKQSDIKSPRSPLSGKIGARIVTHQSSITSQIDIVDNDRKALRDALYQGIFSRHRRTIFAFGSFLRMLRRQNSQYNTIRSSSEGEDEGR